VTSAPRAGRGGPIDFFKDYAAAGRRNATARIAVTPLYSGHFAAPGGAGRRQARVRPPRGCRRPVQLGADGRLTARLLRRKCMSLKLPRPTLASTPRTRARAGAQGASQGACRAQGPDECPVALLVGYDATPDPGLRGPTNFAGLVGRAALADFDAGLARALAEQRCGRARPDARPGPWALQARSARLPSTAGLCHCVKSARSGALDAERSWAVCCC